MQTRGSKRWVEFDGKFYAVRSNKIEIPDLTAMERFAAFNWLIAHCYDRGYSRPAPLAGIGGAISLA